MDAIVVSEEEDYEAYAASDVETSCSIIMNLHSPPFNIAPQQSTQFHCLASPQSVSTQAHSQFEPDFPDPTVHYAIEAFNSPAAAQEGHHFGNATKTRRRSTITSDIAHDDASPDNSTNQPQQKQTKSSNLRQASPPSHHPV
jgi:hypothetical protein